MLALKLAHTDLYHSKIKLTKTMCQKADNDALFFIIPLHVQETEMNKKLGEENVTVRAEKQVRNQKKQGNYM